jgi:UDP-N-acetylglucosamine--N-acetylmuramyl-(pentapeptide) pyrophosphoryl-undecaprenol N-acetylglucosamine transferase
VKALVAGGGTGGHLTPALVIAEGLREAGWSVTLAGATRGIEAQILPTRSFSYHLLSAEPLYRHAWWRNVRWPWLAWKLLREVDAVLVAEAGTCTSDSLKLPGSSGRARRRRCS